MGRNDYLNTVRDALDVMLQDPDIISSTGAVKFTRSDKRTQGRLFLREGRAYAIALTSYPSRIVQRIFSSGLIEDDEDRAQISSRFSRNLSDPSVIDFVLMYQMVSEKAIAEILKNYFVDALDELYAWSDVKAEWRAGEELDSPIVIREVDPESLLKVARNRAAYIAKAAQDFQVNIHDLPRLLFMNNGSVPDSQVALNILSLATGSHTVGEVNERFSLALFTVVKCLHDFWEKDGVELFLDEIRLRSYAEAYPPAVEMTEAEPAEATVVESVETVEPVEAVEDSWSEPESISVSVDDVDVSEENVVEVDSFVEVEPDIIPMDMDDSPATANSSTPAWMAPRPKRPTGFIAPDRKPTPPPAAVVVPEKTDEPKPGNGWFDELNKSSYTESDAMPSEELPAVTSDEDAALPAFEDDTDAEDVPLLLSEEEIQAVLDEVTQLEDSNPSTGSLHLAELPDSVVEQAPEEDRTDILDAVAASSDAGVTSAAPVEVAAMEPEVAILPSAEPVSEGVNVFDEEDDVAAAHEASIEVDVVSLMPEAGGERSTPRTAEDIADPIFDAEAEELVEAFESGASPAERRASTTLIDIIKNAAREFEVNITDLNKESQVIDIEIMDLERQLKEKTERRGIIEERLGDLRSQYKEAATYLNTLRGQ